MIINGKPYGTTCAESELGVRLPKNFSGDYNKYAEKQAANHKAQVADFERRKEITREFWDDMILLNKAMINARRKSGDWESNFVSSVASQSGLRVLYIPEENMKPTMDETYAEENWNQATGGSTRTYYESEPKGLSSLSERQLEILNRIAS